MAITRVFKSGNSQAVRLPVDFHFSTKEVEIFRRNDEVVIREKPNNLTRAFELFSKLPEDFFSGGRQDSLPQEREF